MASSSTEPAGVMADRKRNDIAIDIKKMLNSDCYLTVESIYYSICMVPDEIRELNKDAYAPKVVLIGPLKSNLSSENFSSENLWKMGIIKRKYFKEFLDRSETNLESLVSRVEQLEHQVRDCYPQALHIKYRKEEFVKMILVDAGFILELFYHLHCGKWTEVDALLRKQFLIDDIMEDLYLLENQLPFSFLKELYELAHPTPQGGQLPTFHDLASDVLLYRDEQRFVPESTPMLHFTDLVRKSYLPTSFLTPGPRHYGRITVRSATELHEIGVKLKANRRSWSLLDLQFSHGILRIPKLTVNAETEKLFHNMIALEHCHYPHEPYISDYVFLLSCLIKTDEDADFLIKNGIILNHLDRSNDVRRLFYSLGKSAVVGSLNSAYGQLCKMLNDFCGRPKTKLKAALRRDYYLDLKRNYCKTPLQTLATLGGILLIILTVIQAVCSILQVK